MNRFLNSPRSGSNGYRALPREQSEESTNVNQDPDQSMNEDEIDNQAISESSIKTEDNDEPLEDEQGANKSKNSMSLRVLDLSGKVYNIDCEELCTVGSIKEQISNLSGVRVGLQRLIYRGRVMSDEHLITEYKLEDGHTIHLFARQEVITVESEVATESTSNTNQGVNEEVHRAFSSPHIGHVSETLTAVVFPSDGVRRIDPLMLDTPLGNSARRVKLWSSFLLIIYTMKVLSQFAFLANMHANRQHHSSRGREENYFPQNYATNSVVSVIELIIHSFGAYVGSLGFKAAHETDIRQVQAYYRGVIWLAIFTTADQIYLTIHLANSDYSSLHFVGGYHHPTLHDIVTANILQICILAIMWGMAVHHAACHRVEILRYNESLPVATINPVPIAADASSQESDSSNQVQVNNNV